MGDDYPNQGILDYLTRRDELLIKIDQTLKAVDGTLKSLSLPAGVSGSNNSGSIIQTQNLIPLKGQLENRQVVPYELLTIDMTTAGSDELHTFNGNNIVAVSNGSLDGVTVKFNNNANPAIPLKYFMGKSITFSRIYLSWLAQPSKTLYVVLGNQDNAEFGQSDVQTALLPVSKAAQNPTAELADTDILATAITPSQTPSIFRIQVQTTVAAVFSAMITNGGVTTKCKLNEGTALTEDCSYIFDILVIYGDTVNFQVSVGGNVMLRVQEVIS
ncbi:MAG: hypothetical protein JW967_01540 [Dehalococcoidales bacterium]|nr:hypothetical protein [Dehalococcoidales bacterium]